MRNPAILPVIVLLAASAGLLGSCSTMVVLVDDAYGHEHVIEDRSMHLATLRSTMSEQSEPGERSCFRFFLRFHLENRRDEAWPVQADRFSVLFLEEAAVEAGLGVAVEGGQSVLVTVPPRASAELTVALRITAPRDVTPYGVERYPLRLRYYEEGLVLLDKRMAVGKFSQAGQVVRLAAVVTLTLLVL